MLTRMASNLLDNALRHTPQGGTIALECKAIKDQVNLTVTDTGPGIPPGDLPHLFTPLYRSESSRSRATGGTGLGLAIVHRIVLAHRGTLTASNMTPHGACFAVTIPAQPPSRSSR